MAGGAFLRGGLIKKDRFRVHFTDELMASGAAHVAMSSLQRKIRALVVIEKRGLPLGAIVASHAGGHSGFRELTTVNVLVAFFANSRR